MSDRRDAGTAGVGTGESAGTEPATDGGETVGTGGTGGTAEASRGVLDRLLPRGFRTLFRREILRFVRRPRNTFLPPAITNVLYFSVFGVILGGRIDSFALGGREIEYIAFILPGLIVLGAISNAFENASFSIFHGRWNDYIHEVLTSPLPYSSMVLAYILSSAVRGVVVGIIIGIIGLFFTSVPVARPLYLVAFLLVICLLFASFGVVGGLWARDFDYLTVLNQFILRPLVFFGGVFYSLDALSGIAYTVSLLNPMVYMVNGVRYGFFGASELPADVSLLVLSGLTLAVVLVDVELFRRGYGLVE